jgi:hypothetical protein
MVAILSSWRYIPKVLLLSGIMIALEKAKHVKQTVLLYYEVPDAYPLPTEKFIKNFYRQLLKYACLRWQQSPTLKSSCLSCADIPDNPDGERQENKYSHYGLY